MTQKIYWCCGLPASGKSTEAKRLVDQSQGHLKRVNKDDLRAMIDNYDFAKKFNKHNEAFVLQMRDALIMQALMNGDSAICDDTNFGDKHALRFHQLAAEYTAKTGKKCEVELLDFRHVPPEVCIERDNLRGDKRVGPSVIMDMYTKHIHDPSKPAPVYDKKAYGVPQLPVYVPPVDGLPPVVLCDLDGTLANIDQRRKMNLTFDASRCDELDTINEPVRMVLMALIANVDIEKILFMSGRMDKDREPTLRFIHKCWPHWVSQANYKDGFGNLFELHMRKTNDLRKDAVVKKELFYAHVHGKYNPVLVLDDRNSVIDLWRRDIGLPTFQVAYGDF